jgi:adenylylsulfate kinase
MKDNGNKKNVTWFDGYLTQEEREKLHGHKGAVIWFTGLSASGKSTIAHLVERMLYKKGCTTYALDGDNVRHGLCADLSFSPEDRTENIRRIGEMVKLFVDSGKIVITAFISPYRKDRNKVRSLLQPGQFFEIFVDCPVDVCASRDPKGIYKKAMAGLIKEFTGVTAPYEPPNNPEMVIRSLEVEAPEAAKRIVDLLEKFEVIS